MSLLAAGTLIGGLGAIAGGITGNRRFNDYSAIDNLESQLKDPSRQFANFRRLAQDSVTSRNDLMGLAAATGGSATAADRMSVDNNRVAGDRALQAFGAYRQGIEGLRANLAVNKTSMRFNDFNQRRQNTVSLFNNIAGVGSTLAGQGLANGERFPNFFKSGQNNAQGNIDRLGTQQAANYLGMSTGNQFTGGQNRMYGGFKVSPFDMTSAFNRIGG